MHVEKKINQQTHIFTYSFIYSIFIDCLALFHLKYFEAFSYKWKVEKLLKKNLIPLRVVVHF